MQVALVNKTRVLFLAEVRGNLGRINELAEQHNADIVVHTSTFGFYDGDSASRLGIRTLRSNIASFCPNVQVDNLPEDDDEMREYIADKMSELPAYLDGSASFKVPVYTVWGAVDDLRVIEKFKTGEYKVENLHILDESCSFVFGGLRICGFGGAFRPSSLFNAGEGTQSIPGSNASIWVGAWQMSALAATLKGTKEPRLFVTHSAVHRNPLLEWFSVAIRAQYTFSANLHLTNTSIINRYAMDGRSLTSYERLLTQVTEEWSALWTAVKPHLETTSSTTRSLSEAANAIFDQAKDKPNATVAFRNTWHYVLTDVTSGFVTGSIAEGILSTVAHSSGTRPKIPTRAPANPVHAIFVKTALPEEGALEKLAEEDRKLVVKVSNERGAYIIHFSSPAETQRAYDNMDKNDLNACQIYSPRKNGPSRGRPQRGRGRYHRH